MARSLVRLNGPAGKALAHLRGGPKTVEELAESLRLTPNAVRNQLRKLQDSKLAARSGSRPGISKPSALYSITLEGQIQLSTIYVPVLSQFLRVAEGQCSGKQLDAFMSKTGHALGARYPKPAGTMRTRVHAGARLLKRFGGAAEVRHHNGTFVIRSAGCPLAALTYENSAACKILENLLGEYMRASVRSCCSLSEEPRCCFEVEA